MENKIEFPKGSIKWDESIHKKPLHLRYTPTFPDPYCQFGQGSIFEFCNRVDEFGNNLYILINPTRNGVCWCICEIANGMNPIIS